AVNLDSTIFSAIRLRRPRKGRRRSLPGSTARPPVAGGEGAVAGAGEGTAPAGADAPAGLAAGERGPEVAAVTGAPGPAPVAGVATISAPARAAAYARTSSAVTRPPGPVPRTRRMSTPSSRASRRVAGVASTRRPAGASPSPVGPTAPLPGPGP